MSETALRRLGRSVGRLAAATIAAAAGVAMAPAPEGSAEAVWFPVLHESFTIDSPLGSWGSDSDASKVVYTGM